MNFSGVRMSALAVCTALSVSAYGQGGSSGTIPAVHKRAGTRSASSLAYPQSIFVDSQNGNLWVADFDNNRVLRFDVSTLTGTEGPPAALPPNAYALGQNYPNPFNPGTTITFAVRTAGEATVKVYTVLGQEVATVFRGIATPHRLYVLSFDATTLPSGMYFYALRTEGAYEIKKMIVLK